MYPVYIDHADMELTRSPAMRLSNIRNLDALHAALEHDEDRNTIQRTAELVDCKKCIRVNRPPARVCY